MSRKPAHLEMKGGKSPRQRVWEAMRRHRECFTQRDLAEVVGGLEGVIEDYVRNLLKAGFIEVIPDERAGRIAVRKSYRLVRDNGVEAPRVRRTGEIVTKGRGNEAMWGTMRRMFSKPGNDFNYRELAGMCSTASHPVLVQTAKNYVLYLAAAGYLQETKPAVRGNCPVPARYFLKLDTGPRAPMIQRACQVFDPNPKYNRVMWTEQKGMDDEQ